MLDAEFLAAARNLIRANSVTDRGNLAAVSVLEPLCASAGLSSRRLPAPDTSDRDANLLAGPGGGAGARGEPLLLVTHLDTVPTGPRENWKTDPHELTVDGNRAFGLGAADVKLDALCKLWAARRLKDVPLRRPFYFLGTYGEEAGLRGAIAFASTLPLRPFAVLCGEPSELTLCHAHKGYVVVRVRLRSKDGTVVLPGAPALVAWEGKAAHSSTPQLGVNAIDLALDALAGLGAPYAMAINGGSSANTIPARCEAVVLVRGTRGPAWKTEDRPLPPREEWANVTSVVPILLDLRAKWRALIGGIPPAADARFDPPGAVANVTGIRTERDTVEMTLDARLLPEHDPDAVVAAYRQVAQRQTTDNVDVRVEADRVAGGMSLQESHPLVRQCLDALRSLGLPAAPKAKATSTEAGVFTRVGIPAVVFGPSPSAGNAHRPNEFALLDQVERAIDAYEAMIRRLCQ